ncbi:hypothetical protein LCGC14_2017850, partial [marine sediment metagenome]
MKKLLITLITLILFGSIAFGDTYTSHQKPNADSTLDIGTSSLFWRTVYADAFTDGVLSVTGGSITSAVNGTFSGILTAGTLKDSTATLTGGNLTGMGNITGTDIDISAGTGDYTSTGTGIFGQIVDNGLEASLGVYTDASKQLTSNAPSTGTLGYWTRTGTTLSMVNTADLVTLGGALTVTDTLTANGTFTNGRVILLDTQGTWSVEGGNPFAWGVLVATNSYFNIDTDNEIISFGSTTVGPTYEFLGNGLTTHGGDVTIDRQALATDAILTMDGSSSQPGTLRYESDNQLFLLDKSLDVGGMEGV